APRAERPPRPRPAPPPVVLDEPEPAPRRSVVGTMLVLLLLVAAVGLTIASVLRKGTPDPRPLLEDLVRGWMK
ncbi:MAG: hypothetical protein K1X88_31975, partial [Nannocystaceae bacterium]|nr:hypothetical protein [Nannocystaceae bacterium]